MKSKSVPQGIIILIYLVHVFPFSASKLTDQINEDITITKENIFEPCYKPGFCFFLNHEFILYDTPPQIIGSDETVCNNKTSFCMKLNIKPADDGCRHYEFELGAINLEDGAKDWIAVAFKEEDSKMFSNFFVYCKGTQIHRGVIGGIDNIPGEVTTKVWLPEPELKTSVYSQADKFIACSFKASRRTAPLPKTNKVDFSTGDGYLLMAHGIKIVMGDKDLKVGPLYPLEEDWVNSDRHHQHGKTVKKFTSIKLDECPAAASSSRSTTKTYGVYFIWLFTLLLSIFCM